MNEQLLPLLTFKKQFEFRPEIIHAEAHQTRPHVVIAGMGGSAICVHLLKMLFPELKVSLHNTYGLPASFDVTNTLLILNSYSGDTEEVLDTLEAGMKKGAQIALLSQGGELIKRGEEQGIPYITIPKSDLEPRFSIGFQLLGLLTLMGEDEKVRELREKIDLMRIEKSDEAGKNVAEKLQGTYPVIYSSSLFHPVAYLIKAAVNEGAKTPCFVNQIPEANHNELQSFVTDETRDVHNDFSFLFIESTYDHPRVQKRFLTMKALYDERGFRSVSINKDSTSITEVFEVILTGYFAATYLAIGRDIDPYKTPFIKEFKAKMKQ